MTQTMSAPVAGDAPRYTITDKDRARLKRIAKAWQAFEGELEKPLQKTPEGLDPNVMSNECVGIVNGGVYFLFGKELDIVVEDDAPAEAQTLLDTVWGRKETRIPLLQKLAMHGAIAGTAFLRVVPGTVKAGRPQAFRLVSLNPMTLFVQTAPQDSETVLLYCIEYAQEEQVNNKPEQVFYREEICRIDPDGNAQRGQPDDDDTWEIQHWTRIGQRGEWQAAGEPIAWTYPFPPVFACQNLPDPSDFWGKPDLTQDIIGMNEALNVTESTINLTLIKFALGILYATGAGEGTIDNKPGQIICLPTPDGKIVAVPIPENVANARAFAGDIRSDIDEQSHWPGVALGRIADMPRGNLSGVAVELFYQPALQKTETKRCLYGKLILEVSKALLVLAGMSGDIDVALEWASPLPADALQDIQAAVALEEIGVSKTTRMRKLGYDPEEEAKLRTSRLEQDLNASLASSTLPAQLPPGIPGAPNLPGQTYPPAPPTPQETPFLGRTGGQQ